MAARDWGKNLTRSYVEFVPDIPENVAGAVRTMVQFGADPSVIHKEIEKIIADRDEKQRVQKTLKGVAELAKMSQKPRRFVLATLRDSETSTTNGVLFPGGKVYIEATSRTVLLPGVVIGTTESLEKLKTNLEASDISYHIEFID